LSREERPGSGLARLWSIWPARLVVFVVVTFGLIIGCQVVWAYLRQGLSPTPKLLALMLWAALSASAMILAYRLLVRWTERRRAEELVISKSVPLLAGGAVIGLGLFSAVFICLMVSGVASIRAAGDASGLVAAAAISLFAAVGEEVVFRGVIYRLFEEGFGTTAAVLISGGLFGLLHAANPGASVMSSSAIALEAGVLLAAAYAWTRSLWFPIGLHFGWNFTEGGVFGASVSGGHSTGFLTTRISGPDYLTGGPFGPEASAPAVVVCLAAALVMLAMAARSGRWEPARLRARTVVLAPN
jgi:membrane protease YdiL (CAAX protease family)